MLRSQHKFALGNCLLARVLLQYIMPLISLRVGKVGFVLIEFVLLILFYLNIWFLKCIIFFCDRKYSFSLCEILIFVEEFSNNKILLFFFHVSIHKLMNLIEYLSTFSSEIINYRLFLLFTYFSRYIIFYFFNLENRGSCPILKNRNR